MTFKTSEYPIISVLVVLRQCFFHSIISRFAHPPSSHSSYDDCAMLITLRRYYGSWLKEFHRCSGAGCIVLQLLGLYLQITVSSKYKPWLKKRVCWLSGCRFLLRNSIGRSPSWENNRLWIIKFLALWWRHQLYYVCTKALHLSAFWGSQFQSTLTLYVSRVLILFSSTGSSSKRFIPQVFQSKAWMFFRWNFPGAV